MQNQASLPAPRPFPLFMLPPPLLFGIAFGLGALLQHFVPLPTGPLPDSVRIAGAIILAIGVLMGVSLAATFLIRRTSLNPFGNPSVFVAAGIYRLTRNPMYLSLVIASVGGALLLGSAWPLVTLLIPVAIMARVVIPFEEASMAATFGDSYRAYRDRVRRWI